MKYAKLLVIVLILQTATVLKAQSIYDQPEQLKEAILEQDSQFWKAYNQCNVTEMVSFLTEDLEFYHDKDGLIKGLPTFEKGLTEGLCANGPQIRRQVKEGSVQVFPLKGIGAIISGEHYFYIGDRPDGIAKFTHVWRLEEGTWKMSRVLSYDHQPVPYEHQKTVFDIAEELLDQYAGNYSGPQTGEVTMIRKGKILEMKAGPMELILQAQSRTIFFHNKSSLTFEFVTGKDEKVSKVIVRENGTIVEEVKRL